jgi:hypothetical protein
VSQLLVTSPLLAAALAAAIFGLACGDDTPAANGSSGASGAGSPGSAGTSGSSAGTSSAGTGGSASSAGTSSGGTTSSSGTGGQAEAGMAGSAGSALTEQGFSITPPELVFGAVQQTDAELQTISIKNVGSEAATLASVTLDATASGTSSFALVGAAPSNVEVAAGASQQVQVRFHPTGIALFESAVLIETSPGQRSEVALFGLGTKGLEGDNEPYLKIVLDTLGYDIDVGGNALLSTTTPLVGSEVAAPLFRAAGAGMVELVPVARYSPEEPIPYGYYTNAEVVVGTISNDQYQQLHPTTDAGSMRSFAAPAGSFGIFTTSKTHKTYTEDAKNAANDVKHAARTYPLKDRGGAAVANAYLVCFEEAANGDYQDYVFTLSNVVPVVP